MVEVWRGNIKVAENLGWHFEAWNSECWVSFHKKEEYCLQGLSMGSGLRH